MTTHLMFMVMPEKKKKNMACMAQQHVACGDGVLSKCMTRSCSLTAITGLPQVPNYVCGCRQCC